MDELITLVNNSEEWLMRRVLDYAKRQNYTKYTSTLIEAWRISIVGLSESLEKTIQQFKDVPELSPDENYGKDPSTAFGILEAKRHRSRGTTLSMFLGLMKYYRQAYLDLIDESDFPSDKKIFYKLYLDRFFDRIEIGFSSEWAHLSDKNVEHELEQANREITNEKNKYLTIFESISDPVFLLDKNDKIDNMNLEAAKLFFGFKGSGSFYYGQGFDVPTPEWLLDILTLLRNSEQDEITCEREIRTVEGVKNFLVKLKGMLDVSEKFSGVVAILSDLSERLEQEEKRRKLEGKLLQSQKLESLAVLAGGIAHDFNNILQGILSYTELLALRDLLPEDKNKIKKIESCTLRATELSNQLLAYSGKSGLVVEPTDISLLVHSMSDVIQASFSSRKVACEFTLVENLPPVEIDDTQIKQVILNLAINAAESYGTNPGIIFIETGIVDCDEKFFLDASPANTLPTGEYVFVKVMDQGTGISKATLENIFDPFFTTKFHGRGLGLAAVLGIIREHNGAIKVESEPGKGTTFTVYLPALKSKLRPKKKDLPKQHRIDGKDNVVLLIDDETIVRNITKEILTRPGFVVLTAKNGEEGMELFNKHKNKISVVVLDMIMPKMDGKETYDQILNIRKDVPIIISSGYSKEEALKDFKNKDEIDFIRKPYKAHQLLERVQDAIRKKR